MKTVYLHIGTHKTGTTAVQSFATDHAKTLAKRGVLYPESGRPFLDTINVGHHLLPWTRLRLVAWKAPWGKYAEQTDRVWDDLCSEIAASPCENVLLSSEEFDVLDQEAVGYVADRLKDFDVKAICYLRRLDEFVQAYYTTDVLYHSEKRDISGYLAGMRTTTDYFELVDRWRKHLGETNVQVHFYRRANLKNEDIVVDVFDNMGVDVSDLRAKSDSKFINAGGLPWEAIETVRMLNTLGTPRDVIRSFVNITQEVYRSQKQAKYSLLDKTTARELVESGLQSIERLNTSEFHGPLREAFARNPDNTREQEKEGPEESYQAMRTCFKAIEACLKSSN